MLTNFLHHRRMNIIPHKRLLYTPYFQQRGVALITVLMITLIIMALSVSLAMSIFNEHKTSRNTADLAIARQAAEAALRDAEHDIACEKWNNTQFIEDTTTNPHRCPLELGKQSFNPQICTTGWITAPLSNNSTPATAPNYFSNVNCYRIFGAVTNQPAFKLSNNITPRQPLYAIEVFNKSSGGKISITSYRITARGYGRNSNTIVDLQSIFRPVAQ